MPDIQKTNQRKKEQERKEKDISEELEEIQAKLAKLQ